MEKEYHKLTIKPANPDINIIEDPTGDCHRLTSKTNKLTVSHREQPTAGTINFILGTYKKGNPGDTPYIGENGNWWVSGEDTGTHATGDDGVGISNWELVSTVGKIKTYRITFTNLTTFEYTLEDGADGREVLIQNDGTYIQWQYEGDTEWTNIIALTALKGDSGANIELQKTATHIQWRVVGDTNWIDLIALADLKGNDGRGIVSIIKTSTVGLVDTYTITYSDSTTSTFDVTNGEKGADGKSAYQSAVDGGYTGTEAEFNVLFNSIDEHIADDSIHHTIDDLDVLYEPKNSNIQEHIADTDIHVTTTDKSNWDEKADLDEVLKLDQTTPQTIQGNVNINGNLNAVTTNVNQSTLPSVNASQDAAILQDGSAFTGTDYVMPTNNVAVKFVASAAHTMGDFTVRVKSSATLTSTTATLTGYLYSDSAGSPSTLLATGNSIRHGTITTSYQELSLGTQFNLVAGTTYWLVIRWSSAPTGGNIIFDSNTDSNGGATSSDAVSWTLTNVRLRYRLRGRTFYGINSFSTNSYGVYGNSTNSYGVYGNSTNYIGVYGNSTNYIGVYGNSTNRFGVYGTSTNGFGVYGISTNNSGVRGESTNNFGVFGNSTNNFGVYGFSTNNYGVFGESTNNFGVRGTSTNSNGVYGTSTNTIGVYGSSTNGIGVYGESTNNTGVYGFSINYFGVRGTSTNNRSGYFIRNTATPTSAVPVVEIIQDHASDTNSVLDVKQDGTGEIARFFDSGVEVASIEKGGLGVYKKGVVIGDNTDVASYENRGATRYRENAGGSFYEMVMKKQDGSYAWTTIVSFQ